MNMKPFIRDKNDLESLPAHITRLGIIPLANKKDLKYGELLIRERDDGKDILSVWQKTPYSYIHNGLHDLKCSND